jgi:hypothetical protein
MASGPAPRRVSCSLRKPLDLEEAGGDRKTTCGLKEPAAAGFPGKVDRKGIAWS